MCQVSGLQNEHRNRLQKGLDTVSWNPEIRMFQARTHRQGKKIFIAVTEATCGLIRWEGECGASSRVSA